MAPLRAKPSSPQNENVEPAVIVKIGLNHIQSTKDSSESSFLGAFHERAVGLIYEEPELSGGIIAGDKQVEIAIIVEIVCNDSSGQTEGVESKFSCAIFEARGVEGFIGQELV